MKELTRRDLTVVAALSALWITAIVDPTGAHAGLRYVALAAGAGVLVTHFHSVEIALRKNDSRVALAVTIGLILPAWGTAVGLARGGLGLSDAFFDKSYYLSALLLLPWLTVRNRATASILLQVSLTCLNFLALLVIATGVTLLISPSSPWRTYLVTNDIAIIGFRSYGSAIVPYCYFVAGPMLVLLVGYRASAFAKSGRWADFGWTIVAAGALALTGTRAHILMAFAALPLAVWMHHGTASRRATTILGLLGIATISFLAWSGALSIFFSGEETNNASKLGLLPGYARLFNDWSTLLFGEGLNAVVWSVETKRMVSLDIFASKTELTYLELVRTFGLPASVLALLAIARLATSVSTEPTMQQWKLGLALLLVNAFFNPYLFSPNGMLPLGLIASLGSNREVDESAMSAADSILK